MTEAQDIQVTRFMVAALRRLGALSARLTAGGRGGSAWPVVPGAYVVGDRNGCVAVCALTSQRLAAPLAALPGVTIAGRVYSANLGLEKIVANVVSNPAIRFVVVCGKESPFFQAGQALCALAANGTDAAGRIEGAQGHLPELSQTPPDQAARFRRQVEVVDCIGEVDVNRLTAVIGGLAGRNPGLYAETDAPPPSAPEAGFRMLRPGGRREPLALDARGYFVVTLDRPVRDIVVRHYQPDNTPAHLMRGRSAEAILLGLLREGLISQMSHAGYLGAELAKAETALRLGLDYEQDQPLRQMAQQAA